MSQSVVSEDLLAQLHDLHTTHLEGEGGGGREGRGRLEGALKGVLKG